MTPAEDASAAGTFAGVVGETVGGTYHVHLADGTAVDCSLRGRLKQELRIGGRIVAGDEVRVARAEDASWTVEAVLPRRSQLVRAGPRGKKARIVAANVDRMAVVAAVSDPPFRPETVDRFLVLAEACDLDPVLIVNKMDLAGSEALAAELTTRYRATGYALYFVSALEGRGLAEFRTLLSRGITLLAGPSGVGKSSLLNAIEPGLALRTGAVSGRDGRGRHTTVSARLLALSGGGWVVDTPGFSEVDPWSLDPSELAQAFPEFASLAPSCRFRSCTHLHEPDCAVKEALARGEIDRARYESYRALSEPD